MNNAIERLREGERMLDAERRLLNVALARLGETEKRQEARRTGRLVFGLDLTGSREPGLKHARIATAAMFDAIRRFGSIEVKLVYYRGTDECRESEWYADADVLRQSMLKLACERGLTQIRRIMRVALSEKERLSGLVFVGDHCEECHDELVGLARQLGEKSVPLFLFHECDDYQLDRKASWRGTSVLRHPVSHDKIVVKRGMDGHYVYFSVRDDRDNGSIIDFVQFRQGLSLGAVRKELRPWIGQPPVAVPSFPVLVKTEKDRMKVEAAYAKMRDATDGHPYLERRRALPASLIADERFAGRIRIDDKGNAVFPHFDAEGLSGYELKNVEFTGFASGGSKALWLSQEFPDDKRLVITESAIDALSHAVLFPDQHARYASIGGKPNPQQPELIRSAAARMPHGADVVAAMDADADGRKLAEIVGKAVEMTGRSDLRFLAQEPAGFKDWNDQLRAKPLPSLPYALKEAAPG